MLVVDCLQEKDDSAFPYLWNVPVIRIDTSLSKRAGQVVSTLLDEVFKDYLWLGRARVVRGHTAQRAGLRPERVA